MIHFTQGDMFDLDVDVRVNTVNCKGVMGAGVALAFKKRYPEMFLEYRNACDVGEILPGRMHVWRNHSGAWVINFPTKRHWREKSRYDDIQAGLGALRKYLQDYSGVRVALPALGCGNGGLDWARVAPMIAENLDDLDAEIFVFAPSDSLRLGKSIAGRSRAVSTSELEELGFRPFEMPAHLNTKDDLQVQVKGNAELLVDRWVAVCTSRDIGAREFSALESIARQMGQVPSPPTVALLYQSNVSEEIAEVFLKNGLAVVLLLPFGPLVKKRIGLSNDQKSKITYAIVSVSEPSEKTSAQLERSVRDLLSRGSSALLLSAPDVERNGGIFKNLRDQPKFFVRYSAQSDETIHRLENLGFRSIGRRPDTGEPNLNPLIDEHDSKSVIGAKDVATSQITTLVTAQQFREIAAIIERFGPHNGGMFVSLVFDLMPEEMSAAVRKALF